MADTPETADDIRTIRYKIESIETTQHLLLRERKAQLLDDLLDIFAKKENLSDIYLAVNGRRSQADIVDFLKKSGGTISQPTVSRGMTTLEEEGLIEKVGVGPRGVLWGKKQVVEKVLRLSRHLEKESTRR